MTFHGGDVRAGISMQACGSYGVVLVGDEARPLAPAVAGDVAAAALALSEAVRSATASTRARVSSVTVDLAPLFMRAVLDNSPELSPVAVVRIVPRPAADPALARSPAPLVERLVTQRYTVGGGHDLFGQELRPLDELAVTAVCAALAGGRNNRDGARDVALVAAGSQARPQHERAVAEAVQAAVPGARISAASEFGGQGLAVREATVVLDRALGLIADDLVTRWQQALTDFGMDAALRIARGDGGYSTAARVRTLPSMTLGATDALALRGAAHLAGVADCRVQLTAGPRGTVAGEVRHGLPVVRPAEIAELGTGLVVPTAVLTAEAATATAPAARRGSDVPVISTGRDPVELACIGAAVSQPTGWIDEIAFIESAAQLDRMRGDAERRATAMATANGAEPGSSYLVESSAVALPYSPSGTVRIRVRVAGAPQVGTADRPAVHR